MIRLVTPEDLEVLKPLVEGLKEEYKFTPLYRDFVLTEEYIKLYTDNPLSKCAVLALEGDTVVGFCAFEVQGPFARFSFVYIKPEFRDKGYMKEFLEAFEYWGKNCQFYYIGVSDENVDLSNRGYQKCEVVYMKEIK